jgi:hypothetical protein
MSFWRKFTGDPKVKEKNEAREAQVIRDVVAAQEAQPEPDPTASPYKNAECPHTVLAPHWDSVEDMGKSDKVISYYCQGCARTFTPEEAKPYLEL